jgi:polyisoprenoid-binding protein YceI
MGAYTYNIDPAHSAVKFWVRHLGISKVHGTFSGVSGTVTLDPAAPEGASVEASVDVSTVSTGNTDRDNHLKSPDFFDVSTYPTMSFATTGITKKGEGEYEVTGNLTLHGVTKPVTLKAEVSPEMKNPLGPGYKIGVSLSGTIARDDFGLTYNMALETGGWVVGKEVHLDIDLEIDRPE